MTKTRSKLKVTKAWKRGYRSKGQARRICAAWLRKIGEIKDSNLPPSIDLARRIEFKANKDHSNWFLDERLIWAAEWVLYMSGKAPWPKERRGPRRTKGAARRAREAEEFMRSPEWQALRAVILGRYGLICMRCKITGKHAQITVDHIISRRDRPDLALDEDNLQVLCRTCNSMKGSLDRTDWRGENPEVKLC